MNTVVSHDLTPPITARYIRFRPIAWQSWISMRVELYGCPPRGIVKVLCLFHIKGATSRSCIVKKVAKLFKILISNLFQSSSSSAILVPFCSRITPLVFFFLSKPLFLGFPTVKLNVI